MRSLLRFLTCASLSLLMSGCMGVPSFYGSKRALKGADGSKYYASKLPIRTIVQRISCEVAQSISAHPELVSQDYLITVLLTLQVDDSLDFTPSLNVILPFAKPGTSLTVSEGLDVGGARRRTFSTNYTLQASQLAAYGCPDPKLAIEKEGFYSLRGNLGLDEIIDNGLMIKQNTTQGAIYYDTDRKMYPTFGSTIQFVVTKAVTGFGPLWVLETFKGPAGNAGVVNGKRLDTHSVLLTFSPQLRQLAPTAQQISARTLTAEKVRAKAEKDRQVANATTTYRATTAAAERAQSQLGRRPGNGSKAAGPAGEAFLSQSLLALARQTKALADLQNAADEQRAASRSLEQALAEQRQVDEQVAQRNSTAPSEAAAANQNLLTTMILQNLTNIQPH